LGSDSNPRDASVAGVVRIHRMLRRGTAYGPELPEGVLEDDGVDRGLMFAFVGADLDRQFEFVQSEWINQGEFLGLGDRRDPVIGPNDGSGAYGIPRRPILGMVRARVRRPRSSSLRSDGPATPPPWTLRSPA